MSTASATLNATSRRLVQPPSSTERPPISSENTVSTSGPPDDTVGKPVFDYEEYHPFGSTSWHARDSSIEVSAKRYRYTGKEKDDETGLYYHGARHSCPWLGRWISADPSGVKDGVNRYAYVRGNPIRLKDPTGNASWSEWAADPVGSAKAAASSAQTTVTGYVAQAEAKATDLATQGMQAVGDALPRGPSGAPMDPARWLTTVNTAQGPVPLSTFAKPALDAAAEKLGPVLDDLATGAGVVAEKLDAASEAGIAIEVGMPGVDVLGEGAGVIGKVAAFDLTLAAGELKALATDVKLVAAEAKAATPELKMAEAAAKDAEPAILFGQRRVGPTFSHRKPDGTGPPSHLAGRPISDVAADLRSGALKPDQLPIQVFKHEGKLVSANTRSLSALSEAGMLPTAVTEIKPTRALLARLREAPLIRGASLPGPQVAVTASQSDLEIIRIITIPGH